MLLILEFTLRPLAHLSLTEWIAIQIRLELRLARGPISASFLSHVLAYVLEFLNKNEILRSLLH